MAENSLPISIEVSVDESSVQRSFAQIKQKAESEGRKVGQSLSSLITEATNFDKMKSGLSEMERAMKQIKSAGKSAADEMKSQWASLNSAFDAHASSQKATSAALAKYKADQAKLASEAEKKSLAEAATARKMYEQSLVTNKLKPLGLDITGQAQIQLHGKLADAMKRSNEPLKEQLSLWGHIDKRLRGIALVTTELTRAFFGLSIAVGAVGAPAIFGTRYLKSIEDAKMGLLGTLVTMGQFAEGTNKFEAALGLANKTIQSLEQNALKFGVPLDEILNVFRAITASGLQAGMTLEQIGKSAAIGTVAVRALGLDARQSVQELRDLFMGGIQPASSTLATSLGLRDSDIKKAKADAKAGIKDFYDFMMEQLSGYELVAAERTNTLSGSLDFLGMKLQRLFANEGVFGSVKDAIKGVSDSIARLDKETNKLTFNQQLLDQLYQYNKVVETVVGWLGKLAEVTINNIGIINAFATSMIVAALSVSKFGALTLLVGWLKGISAAFIAAREAAMVFAVGHSAAMTQVVGATAGAKAATIAAVGKTGFIGLILFGGYLLADAMGWLDTFFGRFEQYIESARSKIKGMTLFEKQERLGVVESNLQALTARSVEGYNPNNPLNDFIHYSKKAAISKETGKVIFEDEYNQLDDYAKAEYGELERIQTLIKKMEAERQGIREEIKKSMEPPQVTVGAGGMAAYMKETDSLLKGSDWDKRREAQNQINSLLLSIETGKAELAKLQNKSIPSGDIEALQDNQKKIEEINSRLEASRQHIDKIKSDLAKPDPKILKETKDALKDALTAENIFAEKQDTLVREGAKTYIEAYNDKISKIKEFAEKNGESIKWEERRNEAYKTVSDYLTQHNAQLNKESEQREANTTATLKYGAAVETSGAALLMEQYAREGFLESGFKELALINVLAQSRNDLSKIHEKSVKEQIDSQKELDELVAESSLMFLENEKQKSEFKMQETLKRINAEREEAKKSLELNLKLRMNAGPLSPQEYENYLKTKEAIDKSFMDREETTRKIFNQRVKNAELKDAKETVDKIEGTFKEAFMNIAESGTSGWRSMLNKFKSDFKKNILEYIYKELAKPFVLNVIAQVTGAMGMSNVAQAATKMAEASGGGGSGSGSSIGSALSMGSNLSSLAGGGSILSGFGAGFSSMAGEMAMGANFVGPSAALASGSVGAGAATASAMGSTAAGMMSSVAAAAPYALAALAIADAVGAFGKRGGPQQGQYGSLGAEGYKSSFTMSGGDALGNQALAEVAYGQAANLLKMAGKDIAGLTIGQGYKLDTEGSAAGLAYRNISLNGRTVTGGTFDGNNGSQWVGGSGDAEGAATYLAKLTSSEIEAIANTLNDAKLNGIIASLKKDFDDLADGMARYQTAQALQKGLLGAILSDEEKQKRHLAEVTEYLNKAFADINMAVPTTTEEFRKLIDGVDLTTVAGQTLLTQLGAMGDSFLFVVERAKAAQAQQEEYTNRLAVLQGTTTEQRLAREKELAGALTDGNKAILNQIYALEDHNAIIEKQKEAYQSLSETITTMVDAIKAQNGALKASQSGWQREYGGVDVQGAAERVAAAMGMSVGSVRGMSEADLRSLALSQSQTTTTTDKYADVSKEAMTEALRSGFMATSDALADAVRGGVLFDKLPALLDPFLKPLALNTDDAFQYVANHILSSWDAIMGDGGSGAGKTLAEIVDQFVQGQDLPTSHRVLAGKETTSNFDKLKQDWDDLIAAAAESAKAGAEAAGRMAEEAKKAADAAAAAAKEAEDAFRQLAESVESVFQKYQDNIKKSRIDGMTSQEKVSYFTNQSAQALAALSGGTIQDSETLLKLHDDYIESVMNRYDVELEALKEQFKVTTDLLQTVVDIKGWLDKIKLGTLSTLSPLQKLEESRRQYETTLAAAQGGDIAARQNLTAVAEEYLNQAQSYYASSEDYANIFTNVLTPIEALSEPTKTTAEILAQIEGQDKLFNTQANALRERMIVALETGQNRLVDALGSMKADFIAALGQASALAKAATGVKVSSSDSPELANYGTKAQELAVTVSYNGTSHKVSGGSKEDLVLAAVSSINPGFDYAGAAASNPALIEAWGKDLGIPGYAKGGMANGWSIVGERGPEVVNFAQPTRVYTNEQTQGMFAPIAANENDEEYLKAVIAELQALIRQNGAGTQAVIEELQQVKAELEEIRSKTRMKDAA